MEFRKHQLDNGLELVAECNPSAYSTAVAFFVKTGSRDETDELSGVSHFLEHMAFKGTARRTAADVNRELDEIGSHSNAYTSEEQTVYYATVLPEYQERAVDILADILRPALREDDFTTEKKVILEEIAKYEDQPPFGAHEKCMAMHFGQHPLSRNILGSVESVSALTAENMRAYFEQRYSPSNIVLAAAGNVDFDELIRQADVRCGRWQPFKASREKPEPEIKGDFRVIYNEIAIQQYAVQLANGPATEDERRYAARVLATILGDDSGSRFYWEFMDTGRAEYAAMGSYEYQGAGVQMTYLCCAPDQAAANLRRIAEMQEEIQRHGVTEDELTLAKSKICSHIVLQSERPTNRLFAVGNAWVQRQDYRTVRDVVRCYQAVTVEDVAASLDAFPLIPNTTVAVGPLDKLEV